MLLHNLLYSYEKSDWATDILIRAKGRALSLKCTVSMTVKTWLFDFSRYRRSRSIEERPTSLKWWKASRSTGLTGTPLLQPFQCADSITPCAKTKTKVRHDKQCNVCLLAWHILYWGIFIKLQFFMHSKSKKKVTLEVYLVGAAFFK